MSDRVYLPATLALSALIAGGFVAPPADWRSTRIAVTLQNCVSGTPTGRGRVEYIAFTRAAQESLLLLRHDPQTPRRRA